MMSDESKHPDKPVCIAMQRVRVPRDPNDLTVLTPICGKPEHDPVHGPGGSHTFLTVRPRQEPAR